MVMDDTYKPNVFTVMAKYLWRKNSSDSVIVKNNDTDTFALEMSDVINTLITDAEDAVGRGTIVVLCTDNTTGVPLSGEDGVLDLILGTEHTEKTPNASGIVVFNELEAETYTINVKTQPAGYNYAGQDPEVTLATIDGIQVIGIPFTQQV